MFHRILFLSSAGLLAAGTAWGQASDPLVIDMIGADGNEIGRATFTGTQDGVLVEADIAGLSDVGWHGFHIHETGECDAAGGFESAGGHFAPGGNAHGYLAEGGPHAGDMPNQYVSQEGLLRAEVFNSNVTLDEGETGIRGRAVMVHQGADDYQSQPSGGAGTRVACGVIE